MVSFPNCKINLGLRIIRKRKDGYHDLETVFYPLRFCDVLEITNDQQYGRSGILPFKLTGLNIDGEAKNNLCVKAYKLLKKDFPDLPLVQIHLHKAIPAGSGLGGGSADAAFTLTLLNKKFGLNIPREKLLEYALELGSDCPFFIINEPCYATSKGEELELLKLDLSSYTFILVNPGIHINTGQAFLSIHPRETTQSLRKIVKNPIETWKDDLINDFEPGIFKKHREIEGIKEKLYKAGAIYASLSGSGSTVFGIFREVKAELNFPSDYFIKKLPGGS